MSSNLTPNEMRFAALRLRTHGDALEELGESGADEYAGANALGWLADIVDWAEHLTQTEYDPAGMDRYEVDSREGQEKAARQVIDLAGGDTTSHENKE